MKHLIGLYHAYIAGMIRIPSVIIVVWDKMSSVDLVHFGIIKQNVVVLIHCQKAVAVFSVAYIHNVCRKQLGFRVLFIGAEYRRFKKVVNKLGGVLNGYLAVYKLVFIRAVFRVGYIVHRMNLILIVEVVAQ